MAVEVRKDWQLSDDPRGKEEFQLVESSRAGNVLAIETLIRKYHSFVRLKASGYFIAGGGPEDLIQEGLIGLLKAIRDYRPDKLASFRSFAELCITRQIITAFKTAARQKHSPLNSYLSLYQSPISRDEEGIILADVLAGPETSNPLLQTISIEERGALIDQLCFLLSELEANVLLLFFQGATYEEIAEEMEIDTKSVDNALQRIKRKTEQHLLARKLLETPTCTEMG